MLVLRATTLTPTILASNASQDVQSVTPQQAALPASLWPLPTVTDLALAPPRHTSSPHPTESGTAQLAVLTA